MSHTLGGRERRTMHRPHSFWGLLCLLPLLSVHGQQALDPQATIRKQVDLVLVDVIVTDPKGTILNGLKARDFEIFDESTLQETVHFSQDEIPLAIALVVDVSGSMDPMIEPLRKGLMKALPSLKISDRVALLSFADQPRIELGLTKNFKKVAGRIQALSPEGYTNINDAVYEAADYLCKAAPEERRVVIIVSDMMATTEGEKPALEEVTTCATAVFGIRLPSVEDQILAVLKSRGFGDIRPEMISPVVPFAKATGGVVVEVQRLDGIQPAVERLFQLVKFRYTLGFYPDSPGKPGTSRRLEVRLKDGGSASVPPGTFLTFRTRYMVPSENAEPSHSAPRK